MSNLVDAFGLLVWKSCGCVCFRIPTWEPVTNVKHTVFYKQYMVSVLLQLFILSN